MYMMKSRNKDSFRRTVVSMFWGTFAFFILIVASNLFSLGISPEISFQIDPLNLLSIGVTIYLAIYLIRKFNQQDEIDKTERELLIDYFNKFDSNFTEGIHEITRMSKVESQEISGFFKKYTMYLQELIDLAIVYQAKHYDKLDRLNLSVSKIRELLTYTPKLDDIDSGISIEETSLVYSSDHMSKVSQGMGLFKKAIFDLIICINRSKSLTEV